MTIENVKIDEIKEYKGNAKIHTTEQIEQIKKSIEEFGMNDPIAIWHDEIVEGHGRYQACKELGYDEVPIIRLDHLTDEQRKAYTLVHNKLTMNTGFDIDILETELNSIGDMIDMTDFGFNLDILGDTMTGDMIESEDDDVEVSVDKLTDEKYTTKVEVPHYEITGIDVELKDLINESKTNELIQEIVDSNVSEEQKKFLLKSAQRHLVFNYKNIAEYYAKQDREMQELMEKSALVIVDFDDAIKNGYVELKKEIETIEELDKDEK